MKSALSLSTMALCAIFAATQVEAGPWTYSSPSAVGTCAALDSASGNASDSATTFKLTTVASQTKGSLRQPMKMAFVMDATQARTNPNAKTDIVFVQREGAVKWYNASLDSVITIGTIPNVGTRTEDGLTGIAVDRVFQNRIFVYYSYQTSASAANTTIHGSFRVSRFNTHPTTRMLDLSSEKVLIDIPSFRNRWHTAGAMTMDDAGHLYIAVGDNETAFTGPGNTNSLIGSILRIKPDNSERGYSIPAGNFGDYFADQFQAAGRATLAATYRDPSKVRPEIYVKGNRNPYTVSVVPQNGQLTYSQCGADQQTGSYAGPSETHHITSKAYFAGWPFWLGQQAVNPTLTGNSQYGKNGVNEPAATTNPTATAAQNYTAAAPTDSLNPVIKWTNATSVPMGSDTLPRYRPALYPHNKGTYNCAMGGMVYKYDGRLANPNKLPPQMNNVWIIGDWSQRSLRAAKVTDSGQMAGAFSLAGSAGAKFLSGWSGSSMPTIRSLVDIQQGPDGAIYIMNYMNATGTSAGVNPDAGTGIVRVELKSGVPATCSDSNLTVGVSRPTPAIRSSVAWLTVGADAFSIKAHGNHEARIMDAQGKVVHTMRGTGFRDYSMPTSLRNGVYFLRVSTDVGEAIRSFTRL